STPIVADTPFQTQGHTLASVISYAAGPDTQAVIPAGMSIPAGEVRAEVVSAKPANVWDLMSKPAGEGEVVIAKSEAVVVKTTPLTKAKSDPAAIKLTPVAKSD